MMEPVYEWGLEAIRWVQQLQSPALTFLMQSISFLGDPAFYFGLVLLLYWCVDGRRGFRLGAAIIFAGALNTAIKEVLQVPRPFVRNPSVFIIEESGFSTPSGHSQGSATFYPLFARYVMGKKSCGADGSCRNKKCSPCLVFKLLVAVFLPLLIGFSRIYLGVHYPSDVLLGLSLGFLTSVGLILFWNPVAALVSSWRPSLQVLLAAVVVFALNHFSGSHTSLNGALFGFFVGRIMWTRSGRFWDAGGTPAQRLLRFPLGLLVTGTSFLIFEVVKNLVEQLSPAMELALLLKFIQFAAAGFVVVYLCPLLFIRFGMAFSVNELKAEGAGQ